MAKAVTTFGVRLRELREAAGITQEQLADKAGLGMNVMGRLERGGREPAWPTVLALAKALGVPCDSFAQEPTSTLPKRGKGRPKKAVTPAPADDLTRLPYADQVENPTTPPAAEPASPSASTGKDAEAKPVKKGRGKKGGAG